MDNRTKALCAFLDAAHSVYHAAHYIAEELKAAGYTRLLEHEAWELVPGGKYYLVRGGTAVMAFRVPAGAPKGFLMSASHSDRPTFKVKENLELPGRRWKGDGPSRGTGGYRRRAPQPPVCRHREAPGFL